MSDKAPGEIVVNLRPIDRKRLASLQERTEIALSSNTIWYIHTVLAQCFLPYTDPKANHWKKQNGSYGIILTAGAISDPRDSKAIIEVGLPFGAKPRLFQSYICTQAIKQQSPVIPVERSMTAMMRPRIPAPMTMPTIGDPCSRRGACWLTECPAAPGRLCGLCAMRNQTGGPVSASTTG